MASLTVSAGIARGLIAFAAQQGADPDALISLAGLTPAMLDDADARVSMAAYKTLMREGQRLSGDPALALHWGEAVDLAELSIVGLIMNAAETMGDAFLQMQRFGRLALEVEGVSEGPRFQLAPRDGALWMVDLRADPNAFPELSEGAFARLVCGPRRFLPRAPVHEVWFTHPAPTYGSEYERVFQCPVRFDAPWNGLRLDPEIAGWRVSLQPRYVFGVLTERADGLLKELDEATTTRARVEALLLPVLHTGEASADTVAKALGYSRQTLFRRLKAEGVTFGLVLEDLRHRMALRYLRGRKASVNETAYLVGFSEPAAFSRAFKRWTGRSPRDEVRRPAERP